MSNKNKLSQTADVLENTGKAMQGCGCFLTIFVTIPIIIVIIFLFL